MIEVGKIASVTLKDDLWYTLSSSEVSYPSDGHSSLAKVEDVSFWFKHRNDLILGLLKRFGFAGLMLDIGGGRGFVSRAIQQSGATVILIEPDEYAAKLARQRGVKHVICGTFQDADFAPESIDAVGLFDVIEHIEHPIPFLAAAGELLSQGGLLFATVPAHNWLWSVEDEYAGHFRRYTPETITEHLNQAGFEVEYLSPAFSFLVLPILLSRSLPSKLGIRSQEPTVSANEHVPSKVASNILNVLCGFESRRFQAGKELALGSSLVVVARKR